MIGKRKRHARVMVRSEESPTLGNGENQDEDVFRRYFERQFEPLQKPFTNVNQHSENKDDFDNTSNAASLSDWEGLSAKDSIPSVEVVEYEEKKESLRTDDRVQDAKAFMSAKPPDLGDTILIKNQKQDQGSRESAAEAINLKHDLELQRLLRESHLLDRSSGLTLTKTHRHRAIDLRMQSLGAKTSLFTQTKMPPSHRRGIIAKAAQKEASRRKEAEENGIILEKETKERRAKRVKRDPGVGGPTVGKFSNGTLKLGRRDINDIQGPGLGHNMTRKRRS